MSRRPVNLAPRRFAESAVTDPVSPSVHQKSHSSPLVSICLVLLCAILLIVYSFSGSGFYKNEVAKDSINAHHKVHLSKLRSHGVAVEDRLLGSDDGSELMNDKEGDQSSRPECRTIACRAIPLLQEVYGNAMNRILHVGPGTCGVVLKLLREEKLEAWGIQPFDLQPPVHSLCENIVRKGLVRVADVYRPLPYRRNSFSLIIVTDTVDSFTSKQLNGTLRDLARIAEDGLVLFISEKPVQSISDQAGQNGKISKPLKPRNKLWWQRRFHMLGLQENEEITKRFEYLQSKKSYKASYHIFHLIS